MQTQSIKHIKPIAIVVIIAAVVTVVGMWLEGGVVPIPQKQVMNETKKSPSVKPVPTLNQPKSPVQLQATEKETAAKKTVQQTDKLIKDTDALIAQIGLPVPPVRKPKTTKKIADKIQVLREQMEKLENK